MKAKKFLFAIAVLFVWYIILSPLVAMPVYNTMLFHPFAEGKYDVKDIDGVQCENVYFTSDGKKLHGWYFVLPGASKTILLSHGNAGNITHRSKLVELLLEAGASVFIYDYQGYGKSFGTPSLQGICDDGLAVYNYLVLEKKIKPQDIILFGESIGTGVTCDIASKEPCAGIILQSPFSSLPGLAKQKMHLMCLYPPCLFPSAALDNLSILKKLNVPLLILHGAQDHLIPVSHSEELYAQANQPKQFVRLPDAGHNDTYDIDGKQYFQAVSQFIASFKKS